MRGGQRAAARSDDAPLHADGRSRCWWAPESDPLYVAYHDREWGVPLFDERGLFEHLLLEGFQAGLSWRTILHKRQRFAELFEGFDPERIARFGERDVERLLGDPGIIRNRRKIEAAIGNARACLALVEQEGSLTHWLWAQVGDAPRVNHPARREDVPVTTPQAEALSRALKKRGFSFVGPTSLYAMMQAVGMVNDHLVGCFRHREVTRLAERAGARRG